MRAAAERVRCRVDRIARCHSARPAVLCALLLGLLLTPAAAPATPGAASIGASQSSPLTIAFTGGPDGAIAYEWNFGDGTTSTDQNPTHTYQTSRDYDVVLKAYDLDPTALDPAIAMKTVHVYDTPSADFTWSGGPTVSFSDKSTGEPTAWHWDFGDGSQSSARNPTHTFAASDWSVTLTVSNPAGSSPATTHIVTVAPAPIPPPRSAFTAAPAAGPHAMQFTDASSGGATSWAWSFGDGGTSTAQSPPHAFPRPGSYPVKLTACNATCDATPAQSTVTVPNQVPVADFTIASTPAARGSIVGFEANAAGDPDGDRLTYAWDLDNDGLFDDGTAQTATAKFDTPGTFTVRLRVSDGVATDVQAHTVTVIDDRPPTASFSFAPAAPAVGTSVAFTSSSSDPDGQITALTWDLNGDGRFDDAQGPTAAWTFDTPGAHTVSLRATDDRGVSAIAFQSVEVSGSAGVTPAVQPAPGSAPVGPSPASRAPSPGLMSPFPIVRIRGIIVGGRVRIGVLSVKAPKGATVRVHCRGRSCPVRRLSRRVLSAARSVRFRRLEHSVRAGTIIEVFVRSAKAIGKYTRFDIRAGKAPLRRDQCLPPGSMRPTRCPLR